MSLPRRSRPADEVLAELDAMREHDVRWKDGRAFTLAYYAGPDVAALADEAHRRFSSDNALNTDAFPSLRRIQSDVVGMAAALADELWRRGWYVDRQQPPDSLHCTVNAVHDGLIPEFVAELHAAIDSVIDATTAGTVGSYGTLE